MAASIGCCHNNTPTLQPAFAMATHPHDAWGLWEQSGVTITTTPTNTNPVWELSNVPSAQMAGVGGLLPYVPWPTSSKDMFHFDFIPSQPCQSHPPLLKNVQGKKKANQSDNSSQSQPLQGSSWDCKHWDPPTALLTSICEGLRPAWDDIPRHQHSSLSLVGTLCWLTLYFIY